MDNCNTLIVAKHADVELQDERGATMLHRAVLKKQFEGKDAIMRTLLERGVNIAARDFDGLTARDYLDMQDIPQADRLKQVIDDHVLHLVANEETYIIENLLLDAYDHICDISGKPKKKVVTVRDVAVLKEFKEIIKLVDEHDDYRVCDILFYYTSRGDSWFWLVKGHRLIVMLYSLLSDKPLSLAVGVFELNNTQKQRVLIA